MLWARGPTRLNILFSMLRLAHFSKEFPEHLQSFNKSARPPGSEGYWKFWVCDPQKHLVDSAGMTHFAFYVHSWKYMKITKNIYLFYPSSCRCVSITWCLFSCLPFGAARPNLTKKELRKVRNSVFCNGRFLNTMYVYDRPGRYIPWHLLPYRTDFSLITRKGNT